MARNMRCGFTLIELVVVVLILGVLAGIAVPHLFDVSTKAQASAELRTARVFLDAVTLFRASNGDFPGDATIGQFPSDLHGFLRPSLFDATSPSGGQYDWDGPPPHAGSERFKINYPVGTDAASLPHYPILEEADDGLPGSGWITASGRFISFWP